MRIDAILQSFDYADMLSITLPLNKRFFDGLTVWTKYGDEATKAVCAQEGVVCIETDLFTKDGCRFNRGRAFNKAFRQLVQEYNAVGKNPEWVCILDSDIVLPPAFRSTLDEMESSGELNDEYFYGARRYNIETEEQWEKVKGWDQEELSKCLLYRGYGYSYLSLHNMCSSTFCRLWRETQGNPYLPYPDGSTADWVFRNHFGSYEWDPPTRPPNHILDHSVVGICDSPTGLLRQLPFHVLHLGVSGKNATGRNTPLWNV